MEHEDGQIAVMGCRKCGRCNFVCPVDALYKVNGFTNVDYNKCTMCMKCVRVCPNKALVYLE